MKLKRERQRDGDKGRDKRENEKREREIEKRTMAHLDFPPPPRPPFYLCWILPFFFFLFFCFTPSVASWLFDGRSTRSRRKEEEGGGRRRKEEDPCSDLLLHSLWPGSWRPPCIMKSSGRGGGRSLGPSHKYPTLLTSRT